MLKHKEKNRQNLSEQKTVKDWLPFKDIINGIAILKNGEYVKILEVLPINFKLRSKSEKRSIIINYREFLKACRFPMQISIQCKKSDIEPHIKKMEGFYKNEANDNARSMLRGYINLVRTLGTKGAVSRRFFLVIPYIQPAGVKNIGFADVDKQLSENALNVRDYLKPCGNIVVDSGDAGDIEYILNILYTCINRRTCEVQKFACKMLSLSGILSDLKDGDE